MSAVQALSFDNFAPGQSRQRLVPKNTPRNFADVLHRSVSPLPAKHGMETEVNPKVPNGNTFQERPIDKISERDLAKTVADALVIDFGDYTSKHKRIASAAGAASEKSAENWTQGHNAPSFLYGLRLMAKSPTLQKEILRLCAMERDLSPELQEQFAKFMQMVGR